MSAPDVQTDYYDGQGRILIGKRDPITGRIYDVVKVGNCTALQISMSVDKSEHKESWSGNRGTDLTTYKSKTASGKMTCEDINVDVLAGALWGNAYKVPQGNVVGEVVKAVRGSVVFLANANAANITLKLASDSTVLVEGVDYVQDGAFGRIDFIDNAGAVVVPTTAIDDATAVDVLVDYDFGEVRRLEMFTEAVAPERYIRFEGLNTLNGESRLVECWRAQMDPINQLDLITEDIGNGEINFTLALASGISGTGKSRYYRETRVAA